MVLSDETTEKFAIRCALGNNGGSWATHYTEDQKEHWRQFVRDLQTHMIRGILDQGWQLLGAPTATLRLKKDGTWEETPL